MNFLAHAYLSGNNNSLLVGNFIGDFVKGKQYKLLQEDVARGVLLHRSIDDFTDQHPVVSQSKTWFRKKYRHYASVIVDMAYDHFLAANWKDYHTQDLLQYTEDLYEILYSYYDILPERMKLVLKYMKQDNWLYQYADLDGIHRALTGMSRRTRFDSKMDEATMDIKRHYSSLQFEFESFMPDIRDFVQDNGVIFD